MVNDNRNGQAEARACDAWHLPDADTLNLSLQVSHMLVQFIQIQFISSVKQEALVCGWLKGCRERFC